MRELYRSTYKAGDGFTEDEWWAAVRRAAGGRSFDEFYARFIDGRDVFPWDEILPLAGLEYAVDSVLAPRIGVSLAPDSGGVLVTQVVPGSAAAEAGVATGDYLVRVGDVEVDLGDWADRFRARYAETPEGTPYDIGVQRGGETLTLPTHMRFAARVSQALREDPSASPKAVRVREGLVHGR
jgi:predicted metalloprotease with PDZ domain